MTGESKSGNVNLEAIDARYGELSTGTCCLSCGGAAGYSEAKPGEVCVDLGSGRENDVLRLADAVGGKGFVYGIDVSEGMLKKAEALAPEKAEKLKAGIRPVETECDVLILGGGPAGLAAAIYSAQAKLATILVDTSLPGGQVTVVHQFAELQANKTAREKAFDNEKIKFIFEHEPRAFIKNGSPSMEIRIEDLKTGKMKSIVADGSIATITIARKLE